jgi:hypothetical protein
MRLVMLVATLIVAWGAAPAAAQGPPADEPVVQVGIYSYQPDGTVQGSAFDTVPSLSSVVYVSGSFCQMGAGKDPPPVNAADAWRFSGRVMSKTPDEAVVQVDWQRILDNGRPASTPGGSVQLTLKAGDQVLLDSVLPRTQSSCSIANVAFEARYRPRFSDFPRLKRVTEPKDGRVGGGISGGGTGGEGTLSGRGGAVAVNAGAGSSSRGSGSSAGPGTGRANRAVPDSQTLRVNLWLVHSAPGREDEVLHQEVRAPREGAAFAFQPVTIGGPDNQVTVQVTGSYAVRTNPQSGERSLIFMTSRRVIRGDDQPRDAADMAGSSRIINAMPGPDDVLSFEMPPMRSINGRPALPDRFSVRVRVAPH